ncbi:MAG: ClpXP protease specificity-enhancing factor SspB, partial [Pseudomonadota bacterium]
MKDYLGYEALTQAAMRGVVREALRAAETEGALPGDHHFYITFRTKAPGVKIADHLVEADHRVIIRRLSWRRVWHGWCRRGRGNHVRIGRAVLILERQAEVDRRIDKALDRREGD